ncbi:autotransporter outer membrane beta-barrel domain-containing protein, partial [Dialister invisus]
PRMRRTSEIIYGDKETQMMKGSKTAMTAAALLWRGNNNDLERRMGDIRLGKEENGIWARYLGGKNELDKQKTSYKQTYNIAQAGYDKKKGNWTIGAALDYGTGKDTYASGTGKEKLASLSLYGTMQKEDGQYMDIILKGSRIKNDYTVYNEMNHRLDGKYRTNGLSLSVEYGKRMKKENGFYIDPSIEVTAGHLGGKDYDAVSDYAGGKKMHIHQDGINSVIGRIGLGIGKETERTSLFAKIGLSHEFGGKVKSTFSAEGEPTSGTEADLKDSWIDVEAGGSWLLNRNTYLYGTYTRNFGADLSSKWRIDAGIRFSF